MAVDLYAPFISKSVETGAGGVPVALLVTGKVTGSGVDLDDQVVDFNWAAKALQEWYQRAGNIREMHSKDRAIGKAVDLQPSDDGDGFDVTARITDASAMQKVLDGVLQGFSIGIKRRASDPPIVVRDRVAKGGRIQAGLITEISLVDAPAYPAAKIANVETLWKMAGGGDDELIDDDGEMAEPAELPEVAKAVDADSERKSPPKGYPTDTADYADPSRFAFPVDTPARVRSAMAYYNAGKGKGEQGRSSEDWAAIGRKIASAANDDFGSGHRLEGDQIVHEDGETKKFLTETLSGIIPVLIDRDGTPVPGNVRWIAKADGNQEPVAGDLSYDPFPTEARNGFGAPPDPSSDGAFTDSSQSLAKDSGRATPNGQSVIPGPNDAAHFQPVANPPTPSVPADMTPTPANNLAGGASGGFSHQDANELAKALTANVDALFATGDPDIVKNGVARALGPTATGLLYQMLSNEVGEDGGSGTMACDIASIACAYDKLVCFIQSELAEEDAMPDSLVGKGVSSDAVRALYDMALRLDPSLATETATKAVAADDSANERIKTLEAEIARLTDQNTDLQKSLDATPAAGGPAKTFLAPTDQVTDSQAHAVRVSEALTRFANEQEPRAKQAAWNTYWSLTHPS